MPWSNQDNGWNGNNNQGPWGQGGGGHGGGPQDIDEFLRKGRDKLKQSFNGGGIGARGIIFIIFLMVAGWLLTGFFIIEPDEQGVVLRFGKFSRVADKGLHYHIPYPVESYIPVNILTERKESIGNGASSGADGSLMLSSDQNILDVRFTVLWQVKNVKDFLFNIQQRGQKKIVRVVSESAMREAIAHETFDGVLAKRLEIEQFARKRIQNNLDKYNSGILVRDLKIEHAEPPAKVNKAFEEVQRAKQEQVSLTNEAEKESNKLLGTARGEVAQIKQAAEAYKGEQIAKAEGEAKRFITIYEEYSKAKGVTRKRLFLEMMENVLSEVNKVVIDSKAGSGIVPYLPLNELNKNKRAGE